MDQGAPRQASQQLPAAAAPEAAEWGGGAAAQRGRGPGCKQHAQQWQHREERELDGRDGHCRPVKLGTLCPAAAALQQLEHMRSLLLLTALHWGKLGHAEGCVCGKGACREHSSPTPFLNRPCVQSDRVYRVLLRVLLSCLFISLSLGRSRAFFWSCCMVLLRVRVRARIERFEWGLIWREDVRERARGRC